MKIVCKSFGQCLSRDVIHHAQVHYSTTNYKTTGVERKKPAEPVPCLSFFARPSCVVILFSTKMAPANDTSTTASMSVNLQTPFLYQNRNTGQPSSAPLTARQLCRILCPVNAAATASGLITPQTLLLGFDATTNTYDPNGWRCASSIPILKETCCSWYYEHDGGVKGPVSTRALANLKLDEKTRVFGATSAVDSNNETSASEWTSIKDLQYLQLAFETLIESNSMPTSWPADGSGGEEVANMTFDNTENEKAEDDAGEPTQQQDVADELEAFLSSTDHLAPHAGTGGNGGGDSEDDNEEYESDGGTKYVKDFRTGIWVHEDLAPNKEKTSDASKQQAKKPAEAGAKKRKRNKPKFSAKNMKCWVYVTGLPKDTDEEEVAAYFSKVGILDLDPESQKPKVKLYREKKDKKGTGPLKGDASICYARAESVDLALQILDENLFRDGATLSVQRAKFEQQGGDFENGSNNNGRRMVSEAKRKVARLAALQAVGWDEGENGRIAGGLKGLRIVVLMNMFDPKELEKDENDEKLGRLEKEVHLECQDIGVVEKITVFSKHPAGVIIVKFEKPNDAIDAVSKFNGEIRPNGRKVEAHYWDGVTDYTVRDAEKEAKDAEQRLDQFGDWLENQELSEEFQLKVEGVE